MYVRVSYTQETRDTHDADMPLIKHYTNDMHFTHGLHVTDDELDAHCTHCAHYTHDTHYTHYTHYTNYTQYTH